MSIPEFAITGQTVLVVGGGRGIGKGIVLAFAEAGADVAARALTATGVKPRRAMPSARLDTGASRAGLSPRP